MVWVCVAQCTLPCFFFVGWFLFFSAQHTYIVYTTSQVEISEQYNRIEVFFASSLLLLLLLFFIFVLTSRLVERDEKPHFAYILPFFAFISYAPQLAANYSINIYEYVHQTF